MGFVSLAVRLDGMMGKTADKQHELVTEYSNQQI